MEQIDTNTIKDIVRDEKVDNFITGRVTAMDPSGRYTVEADGGLAFRALNAGGQEITTGDFVAVRLLGGDINRAEISGKTTRFSYGEAKVVWR